MQIYDVTNPQGFFCQSKADVKCKQHLVLLKTIYRLASFLLFCLLSKTIHYTFTWSMLCIFKKVSTRRNDTTTCVSKPLKGDWMCNHVIDTCFVSLNVFFHHWFDVGAETELQKDRHCLVITVLPKSTLITRTIFRLFRKCNQVLM